MRIPYTGPLPSPRIVPHDATTPTRAIAALTDFLTHPAPHHNRPLPTASPSSTVIISGAGISVASGLADYRGANGTYTQNKTYRPIYFHEFVQNHTARQRYWARSFLGFPNLHNAKPNPGHWAVKSLGELGLVRSVITQNVDSFHPFAHPDLRTLELHGYLRSLVCLTCHTQLPRTTFQSSLATLNPAWATLLASALASGALSTENPDERRARGIKTNPDGDVDLPDAPYSTFRYPACPTCLANPSISVPTDIDGAIAPAATKGILKPAVIMFGESIPAPVKLAAEQAVDEADRILVLGSSLATYSAWRLVRRAKERGMTIGVVNLGGVRGEVDFFDEKSGNERGVRLEQPLSMVLEGVVRNITDKGRTVPSEAMPSEPALQAETRADR